ncbi:hypothetical protein [Actinoplanes awajinensis]|uniref:Flavin reductase n=1 Tax=Actinoplanes awajinensis subsp. mycoplanecinus TaxID=135947 RepID=A0A101JKR2_9ACTN|nr:hypothetical protein [Actinoplanes awajinensis]KUL28648.1 hypothetical protein ADL15_31235 [Actinoplanes awajinensis subsp. mycoplanecinus]
MTTTQETEHLHDRPDWTCRVCGTPWPCSTARATLMHEYRAFPSLLRIYLSAQMYEALDDLTIEGKTPPMNLYERFLSWVQTHPPSP